MLTYLKQTILWLKRAFEGYDGKPSHQKILVAYMCLLFTYVVMSVGIMNYHYPESVYHIIAGTILGQSAIRAWQSTKNHQIEKENE